MQPFFDPTPQARAALENLTGEIPGIQDVLVRNHPQLTVRDRAAHQQQVAGSKVTLTVAGQLPPELDGLGVFRPGHVTYTGIGRISSGLGCPHLQTDPDFLGIMLAFLTDDGDRIDFVGINDPTSPADSVADFVALLHATADAAGAEAPFGSVGQLHLGNLAASQGELASSLAEHAGPLKALQIVAHITAQTSRTATSSSAIQQYWTGVVRARETLGKFTLVPMESVNQRRSASPGGTYLSDDWRSRQSMTDLEFVMYWIPFTSEGDTPLDKLTMPWDEQHRTQVGTVLFPKVDPEERASKLVAILATEMGANPGNWVEQDPAHPRAALPATEFTAGRFLAYGKSQQGRDALADDRYRLFFTTGAIDDDLAAELVSRYKRKIAEGHVVPELGEIPA